MFLPTKPHSETIKDFIKEPTIRIGKQVPKNAVNMAYYFNPTATDAEKVLCAEAPRNTIDHRVEESYRYLFNMPSNDDDLFESAITWSDEEGYLGILPRVWVRWHEKVNTLEKSATGTRTVIVDNKSDVPTSMSYSDDENYHGTLFLETVDYEVKNTKTEILNNILKMDIEGYELAQSDVTNSYLDYYMDESAWTPYLYVRENGVYNAEGKKVGLNLFDGYVSPEGEPLVLTGIEKDPMQNHIDGVPEYREECGYITLYAKKVREEDGVPSFFQDKISFTTNSEIQEFINTMNSNEFEVDGKTSAMGKKLSQWQTATASERAAIAIEIYQTGYNTIYVNTDEDAFDDEGNPIIDPETGENVKVREMYIIAGYKMIYTRTSNNTEGSHNWYVYANYSGTLIREEQKTNTYPVSWEATCHYTGIARKVWKTYDGVAYYRGSIVKSEGVGNINSELESDILMYPNDEGYLRKIDVNGNEQYGIEAEQFYITDVFKDNEPCFYKYNLKQSIYDYRGPDDNGFYEGNAIKIYTNNLKDIPASHKYQLKLFPSEYETTTEIIDGEAIEVNKIKKYGVSVYTSFVSKTTDTYKATYNAFVDSDNVNTNNGIVEDVYNYPFMVNNKDYSIVPVNKVTRKNKIKIANPNIIEDTRRYVTFEYQVSVCKKEAGNEIVFTSNKRQAQILNKEYAVESEYKKFIERAMIISPKEGEYYMSPYDIVIKDQSLLEDAPIITPDNAHEFIFYCKPVAETLNSDFVGAINIKCNSDGSGVLTAETTLDTGFYNKDTGLHTKKLSVNNPYITENGKIYAGYMVKCLDARHIAVKSPREEHLLESWYPLIQFGHYSQVMDQYGTHTKICYAMPEYDDQYWGKYGKPYVDIINEKAEILNSHMIKVRNNPLMIREDIDTIRVIRKKEDDEYPINIEYISFSEGIIITREAVSENDVVLVDYSYLEENYVYRGFYRNDSDFCRIDLNPNQYHTYSDLNKEPSELAPTKNLFNKTLYFYLRPSIRYRVDSDNDDLIDIEIDKDKILLYNKETLYHTIDKYEPESEWDIYIGSVYIRQNTSLQSTVLIDTRTRGGGVIEEMKDSLRKQLEPESDFYLDIGCYDGTPYQENAVIIVRLDNSILKEYGGRFTQTDVEQKVKKWLGLGVYPIIEYVDSYSKYDMPQYNLVVENSYTNVIDQTPELTLECVSV